MNGGKAGRSLIPSEVSGSGLRIPLINRKHKENLVQPFRILRQQNSINPVLPPGQSINIFDLC